MSDTFNFDIKKGIPFYKTFRYEKIIDEVQSPHELFDAKLCMQLRHTPANPNILFEATEADYLIINDPINGEVTVSIPVEVVNRFNFKHAVYDIIIKKANTDPVRLIGGKVTVEPLVTRGM